MGGEKKASARTKLQAIAFILLREQSSLAGFINHPNTGCIHPKPHRILLRAGVRRVIRTAEQQRTGTFAFAGDHLPDDNTAAAGDTEITESPENDGLGFTYKWNMGWMHDFLDYMKLDPFFRKDNHNKMTFGMSYATSEKYILVLSHDEVVHLKCSMINKMPGYEVDKFANLKCGYLFMFGHAGKKLLFMGQDFAQYHE